MTVVITGASRGIGAGLAAHYRAQEIDVTGTSRSAMGDITLDVTLPSSHTEMAAALGDKPVELLVCNAGVFLDRGDDLDTGFGADLWAQSFATNVTGVFLSIQALLPHLRRASNPRIAIISSQMGSSERAGGESYIYRASKAAAVNLGRNMAVDLKEEGIALGIYHPGWVQTDMGGAQAAITVDQSVAGLVERFAALSLATTGRFENYDGSAMPF
jgi:NAD(P)-dependent dehydrogenase (short-subunit alcohol dehydrogenase family)